MKLFVAGKAVIFNDERKILVVRESGQYDEGTNVGRWDFPGGRFESNETIDDGLLREVKEETGLDVKRGRLLDALENFPEIKDEKVHIIRLYYECFASTQEVQLSEDHDEYKWIATDEFETHNVLDKEIITKLQTV